MSEAHHHLKTWPQYFEAVSSGEKTFEVRKNDRNFKVGDILHLDEWCPSQAEYLGRSVARRVTYITDFGQREGCVIMGIEPVSSEQNGPSLLARMKEHLQYSQMASFDSGPSCMEVMHTEMTALLDMLDSARSSLAASQERVRELEDFVSECVNDDLERISPGMKMRARALIKS